MLAPHLAAFLTVCFFAWHFGAHLAPHFIMALGAHLAGAVVVFWAAAGKARVAAVKAASVASFSWVFMRFS